MVSTAAELGIPQLNGMSQALLDLDFVEYTRRHNTFPPSSVWRDARREALRGRTDGDPKIESINRFWEEIKEAFFQKEGIDEEDFVLRRDAMRRRITREDEEDANILAVVATVVGSLTGFFFPGSEDELTDQSETSESDCDMSDLHTDSEVGSDASWYSEEGDSDSDAVDDSDTETSETKAAPTPTVSPTLKRQRRRQIVDFASEDDESQSEESEDSTADMEVSDGELEVEEAAAEVASLQEELGLVGSESL